MAQMMTQSQSKVTTKQHTSPCSDCPWARKSLRGWLGGLSVIQWLAKVHSDVKIDCHTLKSKNYGQWQCAGSSIYRANVCKSSRDESVLRLKPDVNKVFTFGEFEKHHEKPLFNIKD